MAMVVALPATTASGAATSSAPSGQSQSQCIAQARSRFARSRQNQNLLGGNPVTANQVDKALYQNRSFSGSGSPINLNHTPRSVRKTGYCLPTNELN